MNIIEVTREDVPQNIQSLEKTADLMVHSRSCDLRPSIVITRGTTQYNDISAM